MSAEAYLRFSLPLDPQRFTAPDADADVEQLPARERELYQLTHEGKAVDRVRMRRSSWEGEPEWCLAVIETEGEVWSMDGEPKAVDLGALDCATRSSWAARLEAFALERDLPVRGRPGWYLMATWE